MVGLANDKHQAQTNGIKAISREWVYSQACRLSNDIHFVSHSFIPFQMGKCNHVASYYNKGGIDIMNEK